MTLRGPYRAATCRLAGCDADVVAPQRYYCSHDHYNIQKRRLDRARPHRRPETHPVLPRTSFAIDDVDFMAVTLAVEGRCAGLNRGERRVAVAEMVRRGHPTSVIAERLLTTRRTVARDRAALGISAAPPLYLQTEENAA